MYDCDECTKNLTIVNFRPLSHNIPSNKSQVFRLYGLYILLLYTTIYLQLEQKKNETSSAFEFRHSHRNRKLISEIETGWGAWGRVTVSLVVFPPPPFFLHFIPVPYKIVLAKVPGGVKHRKTGKALNHPLAVIHAPRTPLSTNKKKSEKEKIWGGGDENFVRSTFSLGPTLGSFIRDTQRSRASCSGFANAFEQQCSHVHIARVLPLILHFAPLPLSLRTSWQTPEPLARASWLSPFLSLSLGSIPAGLQYYGIGFREAPEGIQSFCNTTHSPPRIHLLDLFRQRFRLKTALSPEYRVCVERRKNTRC